MSDLVRDDAQTRLVALSRNFGHELATRPVSIAPTVTRW
jgi:hypothetical protein